MQAQLSVCVNQAASALIELAELRSKDSETMLDRPITKIVVRRQKIEERFRVEYADFTESSSQVAKAHTVLAQEKEAKESIYKGLVEAHKHLLEA